MINYELDEINNSRGSKIPKLVRKPDNMIFVTTMEELRLSCPKETVEDSCSEKMPDMRERIEDRKGELN